MLGLPFVVVSVANCLTLRTGCFISRSCPAWSEKIGNSLPASTTPVTCAVTHKQTFNCQACATKKEATLLLFELSISLCTRTVNRLVTAWVSSHEEVCGSAELEKRRRSSANMRQYGMRAISGRALIFTLNRRQGPRTLSCETPWL